MTTNKATSAAANLRCYDSPSSNGAPLDLISSSYASPEDVALHAEAKRRVQRSTPSLSDEQWNAWLTQALRAGARIVLTLDGCLAAYPRQDAHTRHHASAMDHSK